MTFIDLFAGIGGFRVGMELAGHKCLGHCEIDQFANMSYTAMHLLSEQEKDELVTMNLIQAQKYIKNLKKEEWYATDIRAIRANDIPFADCWCFGFPCQDISTAGNQTGFSGPRSSLFFAVTRLIRDLEEKNKPTYLFIENVKNLLSVNGGFDFAKLLIELDEIGYNAEWQVLNSKDFGVPHNRERVFIVASLRGRCATKVFPISGTVGITNIKVAGNMPTGGQKSIVYNADGIMGALLLATDYKNPKKVVQIGNMVSGARYKNPQRGRIYSVNGISPTLNCCGGGNLQVKVAFGINVRKLTPLEYFRLQGFDDGYFCLAQRVNSDSQLYKQAGNSVTVNVIYEIARRLNNDKNGIITNS